MSSKELWILWSIVIAGILACGWWDFAPARFELDVYKMEQQIKRIEAKQKLEGFNKR